MIKHEKEILNELSKEQLIYLIEQLVHSQFLISSVCVRQSKWELDSSDAIKKIRSYLYRMPSLYEATETKAFIDMQMKKISVKEYRKIIGLE